MKRLTTAAWILLAVSIPIAAQTKVPDESIPSKIVGIACPFNVPGPSDYSRLIFVELKDAPVVIYVDSGHRLQCIFGCTNCVGQVCELTHEAISKRPLEGIAGDNSVAAA